MKKNNNQKLNNFNIIENIEISLEFDGNEKLNSLKKVNSNNNLKITNNISTQTTTQTPNLNSDNNSNNIIFQGIIGGTNSKIDEGENMKNEIINTEPDAMSEDFRPSKRFRRLLNKEKEKEKIQIYQMKN